MEDSAAVVEWLVNHRLQREAKVLKGLRGLKSASMDELVAVVYDDVDVSLHQMAKLSLHAHLIKLEAEKIVISVVKSTVWKVL
jgi:hypothetical protein